MSPRAGNEPSDAKAARVSVIIPFWNAGRYLEEAVRSVQAQTYSDWELLLVDDGSTDNGSDLARHFAEREPDRIRYLTHPEGVNRGASASRNLGIAQARGEFIAFLDGDDVYLPHKLADQVPLLDSQPGVAMVYGRSRLWFMDDQEGGRERYTRPAPRLNARYQPPALVLEHLRDPDTYPTTCSVLIRRAAIDAVGPCEESFRNTYEDVVLFMKLLLHFPVYVSGECWDRYRRHPDSCWAVAERTGEYRRYGPHPAREAFLRWMEAYFSELGLHETESWRVLQRQLRPYRRPRLSTALALPRAVPRLALTTTDSIARSVLPEPVYRAIRKRVVKPRPWKGWVRFGSLRRTEPISRDWGYDRGTPVDRYYIERFLQEHADDVRGAVLEVAEDTYTRRFGGPRVTSVDVLHVTDGNPQATIVGDLADAPQIPDGRFDCIILTQTLQYVFDLRSGVRTLYRILKPGGVVLATLPGISEVGDDESGAYWNWSFTPTSARRLFREIFPPANVIATGHGNVLAATAFLHGLAAEELRPDELDALDPHYVVSTTLRAVKPRTPS